MHKEILRSITGVGIFPVISLLLFVAVFVFDVAFPWVVLTAGLVGFAATRAGSRAFTAGGAGHGPASSWRSADLWAWPPGDPHRDLRG